VDGMRGVEEGEDMRVAVCCKGVPVDAMLESVQIIDGDIKYMDTKFYVNEGDAYALEAAVVLKTTYKAETIALTVGPLRAQEVLSIAIAKGIDQVIRIDGETSLPELIAGSLIPPLKELAPQLILTGVQSEDWMGGEVGVYLAQALNMGVAFAVMEICELTDNHVRIKKEIGGGRQVELRLGLPAVLCVQTGIEPLRYLSAMKRQKARNAPIKSGGKLDREGIKQMISGMVAYDLKKVSLPSKEGHAEMITGERPEGAKRILEIIGNAV
jgi:electron transfer flavoprotein beta subunit